MLLRCKLSISRVCGAPFWAAAICAAMCVALGAVARPAAAAGKAPVRSIVALATLAASTDSLSDFIAGMQSDDPQSISFRNAFGGTDVPLPSPHVVSAYEQHYGRGTIRQLMVAPDDPFFPRWESDARERLATEKRGGGETVRNAHPLAIANPDKAVVICEAGCASGEDEIVYSAPAAFGERLLEVAASGEKTLGITLASVDTWATENGGFECLAGCYGPDLPEPARHLAFADRLAKAVAAALADHPALADGRRTPQAGYNGAIIERHAAKVANSAWHSEIESHILHLPPTITRISRH